MFGSHDHNEDKKEDNVPVASVIGDMTAPADDAVNDSTAPTFDASSVSLPDPVSLSDNTNDGLPANKPADDVVEPVVASEHEDEQLLSSGVDDDLIHIKQEALQQLSPLVGHLDQSPEEKFRTTMMMIQASDDQSLLHVAYEAAKNITDDKVRAQALLDVINEINYFTQQAK